MLGVVELRHWGHIMNILCQNARCLVLGGIILTVTALSGPAALAQDGISTTEGLLGLSTEEQRWLSDNPVIRVHNELDWPPFNFNEDGVSQGLSIDVMNLLAEKAGLQVEYISGPSWSEFLEMMKSGDLDVMLNIVKTPDRQTYMLYTRPYTDNPNTILSRRDTPYESLEQLFGKTISVPKGFFYEEILKRDFPRIKLHLVKDTLEAMKAVTFGEADAALGELAVFNYLKTRHLITDLVLSGEVSMGDPEYALLNIATRKDLPLLASILDKALKTVTSEQKANIRDRWVGDRAPGVDVTWVIRIGGVVLVLLLGIALWNWRLRREIHNRRRIEDAQRTILEAISLPIIVVEQSSSLIKYLNKAAAAGRDRESMIGTRAEDFYWNPSDRATFLEALEQHGKVDGLEAQLKSGDGQPTWVLMSSRKVVFEGAPSLLSTWTDIAENKRVEEALRESEHRLLSILEESPTGTSITRRTDGRILWGNRRVAEMFGVDLDELLELSARDLYVDPRQREEMLARFERDGSVRDMELPWKRMSDGETVWILLSAVPFVFEGEQALLGWHYDVTERKKAEQAQRDLLEMIPFRLVVSDAETSELLYVNENARNAYGLETDGGRITTAYKDPEQREELVRRLRRDGRVDEFEAELYSSDGTPEWLLVSARLMNFEGQRAVLAVSQVITDRKRAETDLAEKEAQLRVALENMPGGICYTDKDRNYIFFNSQYNELYGFPEGLLKVGDHVRVENLYQAKRGDFGDGDPEVLTDEWMSHRLYESEPTNYERHIGGDRILDCRMQPTALGGIVTVVTDITERKHAEEALRESEERLLSILEDSPIGTSITRKTDGRYLFVNRRLAELRGVDPEILLESRTRDFFDDPNQRQEILDRIEKDGVVRNMEIPWRKKKGDEIFWSLVSISPFEFEGEPALLGWSYDITDRKLVEEAVSRQATLLNDVLENASQGISAFDNELRMQAYNTNYQRIQRAPDNLFGVGKHILPLTEHAARNGSLGEGDPKELAEARVKLLAERDVSGEFVALDGRTYMTNSTLSKDGSFVVTYTDITERKAAEEDLLAAKDAAAEAEAHMVDAIENVSEGFALFDRDDRLVLSNSKYRELYGYSDSDVEPGILLAELIQMDFERGTIARDSDGEETLVRRTETYGETDETFDIPLADGRWLQIRDRRTSDGGTVSIHADITERKRAEEDAEAATRAKSDFIAVVSHEVRTPMNGVLGMARLLLESSLPLEQHDFARTIVESGEALLSILNDLLDISKLEAGKMDLETTPFSARPVFEDTVAVMGSRAREKGLHLNCAIDPGVPVALVGDANRLRQILLNLLSNAVKFTDQGDVSVDVTGQLDDRGRFVLEMAVSDTGVGISVDAVDKLFSPYVQESAGVARKYGGTGLGLSISRNLADLMGGTIALVSEVGQGSTFTLTVPFEIADAAAEDLLTFADRGAAVVARPSPAESDIGLNLLVVEDNLVNRKVAVGMLGKLGHAATVAENGQEALELMDRAGPFDVVLMDRHMPVMDGLEATRRIRAMDGPLSAIPIIGVTAAVTEREIEACLEIGMNDVVTKPIDPDALAAALVRVTPAVIAAGTAGRPTVAQAAVAKNAQAVDSPVLNPKVLDRLREDFGDDGLAELVDDFGQISPASVAGTLRAVEADDAEHMIRFSHDLKGSAASLGLMRLSALCRRIEVAGMDDRTSEAREMGQGLQSTLDEALQALASYVKREADARSEPDDARRKFLDKMTHDLRNQINGVMGWVMLLEEVGENHTPEELEDYVSQIREEGVLMQALAANIQTLFRIDSGQYEVAPEPLEPARLAHLAIDDAGHEAQPRGISLDLEIEDDLPVISVDGAATRQMLGNLIANALQVTPDGGKVKLCVNREPTELVITVSDQGPALTAADLAAMRRPYGGIAEMEGDRGLIGFRFNVVDQLAGLVGGRLEIENGEEGGTRATLSLPGIVQSVEAVGNA